MGLRPHVAQQPLRQLALPRRTAPFRKRNRWMHVQGARDMAGLQSPSPCPCHGDQSRPVLLAFLAPAMPVHVR